MIEYRRFPRGAGRVWNVLNGTLLGRILKSETNPGMNAEITARRKPEEEELARKQSELAELEVELAERELGLANFQSELAAFEGLYLRTVGVLYAELDDLNAQIAERIAKEQGSQEATSNAAEARERAQESYSAAHSETAGTPEFHSTPELKSLYRAVAKTVHPDLTSDPEDRVRREKLMADANRAYERGDEAMLRRILDEYESGPEGVQGSGVAADLVRVIRKITQARNRLVAIEESSSLLQKSGMAELMTKSLDYTKLGRDLLAELALGLRVKIEVSRQRLASSTH